jgi:hypothetical protein
MISIFSTSSYQWLVFQICEVHGVDDHPQEELTTFREESRKV